jgi:hypothetical protein
MIKLHWVDIAGISGCILAAGLFIAFTYFNFKEPDKFDRTKVYNLSELLDRTDGTDVVIEQFKLGEHDYMVRSKEFNVVAAGNTLNDAMSRLNTKITDHVKRSKYKLKVMICAHDSPDFKETEVNCKPSN